MQLQAAVVPPRHALEHAMAAAQTLRLTQPRAAPEESPGSGLLQRLTRRGATEAPSAVEAVPSLMISEQQFVRLTRFGNVSNDDLETLGLALGVAAWDWPAPVVHLSGVTIDTTAPRPVITAHLGGDTEGLREIFRSILEVAQSQRFFLDRRIFQPEFPVATVEVPDDYPAREHLELEMATVDGVEWRVTHFSLLGLSFGEASHTFEEIAVVPLGAAG